MRRPELITVMAFTISTILGGNNAIAVRFSNAELSPFFGAAVRFIVASLILFGIVLALKLPLPSGRALLGVSVFGALQFGISYAFLYWSLLEVHPGLVQVVLSITPLFTFVFAIAHRQERFKWKILIGGIIALIGIAIIFRDQLNANVPLFSLFAVILAAACFAEAVVLFKTFPKSHPITTNAISMAVGAAILFAISLLFREFPQLPNLASTWIALLYLIFFGSVGTFVLTLYVLSRWTASATSYQLVLMPIVTILSASWITHEKITLGFLGGALVVIAGVYVGAIFPPEKLNRIFIQKAGDQ
jgi:drug/metabolite transporter (DMT)-like permease